MGISYLEGPTSDFSRDLQSRFSTLTGLLNWANGRDIKTLAKSIFRKAARALVTENVSLPRVAVKLPAASVDLSLNPASGNTETYTNTQTHLPQLPSELEEPSQTEKFPATKNRDGGVTDEVWNQLIQDKQTAIKQEGAYRDLLKQGQQLERDAKCGNEEDENEVKKDEGTEQQHEQERLQRELERRAKEEELRKLRKKEVEMEGQRKKEQQAQKELRKIGVCVQGFRWIKQAGGYRCAGGSHYVSDGQLGI
ncbi:uncharacterized protein ASPGLDRAFT_36963 [Aspergillus glaucus CBS 516.65]|uniref:Uncharacterized protein n=1 Tax=Aspergillus glaucus CBS 516.65 TaxID=1160497 RepID=A0A1L9VFX6_ASPGL|nr:hypothetical protein ASPGLDRAFT_36963 [Aspergillus glaucus CBS 516.65]OJJ82851.1 hypothetical protein ASPGLDRAFT_36963 [Aspergillus glaucus CBS 516.65]